MRVFVGLLRFVLVCGACAVARPALAEWREASSNHFVIYADDSAKDLQRLSEYLERYHAAMELVSGIRQPLPSPSNRVTIFVVGSESKVRDLYGGDNRFVAGFYNPRAGATRAFVPKFDTTRGEGNWSLTVLLHEYAHHFLISSRAAAVPRWMDEGAAEFYASTNFERDGGVEMGRPANHRANELFYATDVPIRSLLDDRLYWANKGKGYDAFYGRAWLLFHYLKFSTEREGQFRAYSDALMDGMAPIAAGEKAFGDLDQLEKDLNRYLKGKMAFFNIPSDKVPTGPIAIRELPEGMAKMMPVRIRSQRGVNAEQAADLVVQAREIAARYPGDPGVLTALAEAEFDAGNDEAAIAAADRALALDPSRANAYVQKGYALFRMAGDAEDADKAFSAAMAPFSALNKLENDHPLPLIFYYRSYVERGKAPPEPARHALERAAMLAPFDKDLWLNMVLMLAGEGKNELAAAFLQVLVADPHNQGRSRLATILKEQIAGTPDGVKFEADWDTINATLENEGEGESGEAGG